MSVKVNIGECDICKNKNVDENELITVRKDWEYTNYCKDCYFNTFYKGILESRFKNYYDMGNEIVNDRYGNYIAEYNLSMTSVMYHSYKRVKEDLLKKSFKFNI